MRKEDVEGKVRISLFQAPLIQCTQPSWDTLRGHHDSFPGRKIQWQSFCRSTTIVRCYSWGMKAFDIPFFSWHKERKSRKIRKKSCPRWGRLLSYSICYPRLLKAHRRVWSEDQAYRSEVSFSPKAVGFPFPPELNLRIYKTRQQPYTRCFPFYLDT